MAAANAWSSASLASCRKQHPSHIIGLSHTCSLHIPDGCCCARLFRSESSCYWSSSSTTPSCAPKMSFGGTQPMAGASRHLDESGRPGGAIRSRWSGRRAHRGAPCSWLAALAREGLVAPRRLLSEAARGVARCAEGGRSSQALLLPASTARGAGKHRRGHTTVRASLIKAAVGTNGASDVCRCRH